MSDDQPGDEFDWDQSDSSQYCKHGTFIGSWWGPDLMCGPCEDGMPDEEFQAMLRQQYTERIRNSAQSAVLDDMVSIIRTLVDVTSREATSQFISHTLSAVKTAPVEALELYVKASF